MFIDPLKKFADIQNTNISELTIICLFINWGNFMRMESANVENVKILSQRGVLNLGTTGLQLQLNTSYRNFSFINNKLICLITTVLQVRRLMNTYLAASFHFPPEIPNVLPQLNANQPHLNSIITEYG